MPPTSTCPRWLRTAAVATPRLLLSARDDVDAGMWSQVRAGPPATGQGLQLALLAMAVFLVFFQSQTVAPLIPVLAAEFAVPATVAGLLVPAYAYPYGVMALVYGPLSDRLGRRRVVAICLGAVALGAVGAALAPTLGLLLALRVAAGLSAGGVMPVSLAYVADVYPYRQRGRAIGTVFAGLALGQALGFSLGPVLEPWVGWRAIFGALAAVAGVVLALFLRSPVPPAPSRPTTAGPPAARGGYWAVLAQPRASRVYAFSLLGSLCSTGSSAWFGVYVHERYGLDTLAIGLAYLGYGVAGAISPFTGMLADRVGRALLIPGGLATLALGALLLALQGPLPLALVGIASVALGLQLVYPLLAGLASELAPHARGLALGLNTFATFMGVGSGALLVGLLVPFGFGVAFGMVALVGALAALAALALLRGER